METSLYQTCVCKHPILVREYRGLHWIDSRTIDRLEQHGIINEDWAERFLTTSYLSEESMTHELMLAFEQKEKEEYYASKRNSAIHKKQRTDIQSGESARPERKESRGLFRKAKIPKNILEK